LRDLLVVAEWYSDGKEKTDSRLRGNDIWGGGKMTEGSNEMFVQINK